MSKSCLISASLRFCQALLPLLHLSSPVGQVQTVLPDRLLAKLPSPVNTTSSRFRRNSDFRCYKITTITFHMTYLHLPQDYLLPTLIAHHLWLSANFQLRYSELFTNSKISILHHAITRSSHSGCVRCHWPWIWPGKSCCCWSTTGTTQRGRSISNIPYMEFRVIDFLDLPDICEQVPLH
jgi:hypothetical protein